METEDKTEEVAFDLARAAIDKQHVTLTNLRTRAGTLLAAASLAASFLGGPALDGDAHHLATGVGIIALLGVLALVSSILWPAKMEFRVRASMILDGVRPSTPAQLYEALARALEDHHDRNQAVIDRMMRAFRFAVVALGIETLALMLAV